MIQPQPEWKPLEAKIGPERCRRFMYMKGDDGIHQYKHIVTRTYLNLDNQGNCYVWNYETGFLLADFSAQLSKLEADLLHLGWDPQS
jgi:hypothetical protein